MRKQKRVDPCESCVFFESCGCGLRCASYLEKHEASVAEWSDFETDAENQARANYYRAFMEYSNDFDDDECYP